MLNYIFTAIALIFSFTLFQQSTTFNTLNRIYLGIYKGLFDTCVIAYDADGYCLDQPYFDRTLTKRAVTSYFDENLQAVVKDYSVTVNFYTYQGILCTTTTPTVVRIEFTAEINDWQDYSRVAVFSIKNQE
ncbi:MAG: hypothetical protein K6F32_01590 [Bacilli bacterium]|nr:hypothetical protein [Bacilli bacterium]